MGASRQLFDSTCPAAAVQRALQRYHNPALAHPILAESSEFGLVGSRGFAYVMNRRTLMPTLPNIATPLDSLSGPRRLTYVQQTNALLTARCARTVGAFAAERLALGVIMDLVSNHRRGRTKTSLVSRSRCAMERPSFRTRRTHHSTGEQVWRPRCESSADRFTVDSSISI